MLQNKNTCYSWTELRSMTTKSTREVVIYLACSSNIFSFFLVLSAPMPSPYAAQEWTIALRSATNSWYVVKCVSQKRNRSNNKNEWYNILVHFMHKFTDGLLFDEYCLLFKVGLGILQITSAKRCPQVWPWIDRSLFSTNFVKFDQAV